jgi:hypothetical protein
MSETFKTARGTQFEVLPSGALIITNANGDDLTTDDLAPLFLADLLEFADSIERRECGPVGDDRATAWMEVFDLCRTLGMTASRNTGLEDVKAFISNLHASQQLPSERTKLLAMMAATIASGHAYPPESKQGSEIVDDVLRMAKAILDAVEREGVK